MTTAVKLNNKSLNHKDGLIYLDNLNETLDSGIIVCESVSKLEINPMDEVSIRLPDGYWYKYLVSEYVEEVASYNPAKYNYQIQYVSPVLKFERIALPNLAITKVFKPTESEDYLIPVYKNTMDNPIDYYTRSVGYYIRQYLDEYYLEDDIVILDTEEFMVKADATICPEMTFNRPNLREVMQALFDVLDLIFTLRYNVSSNKFIISSISPNIKNNAIDTSKLTSDVTRNSINTYASNLDIELQNAISNQSIQSSRALTVRSEGGILTTDNAKIILDNPIYAIKYVQVNITAIPKYDENTGALDDYRPIGMDWVDITEHVVEESVYQGLKAEEGSWNNKTKYNTLYYRQGGNTIEGLGNTHKYLGIFTSNPVLYDAIIDSVKDSSDRLNLISPISNLVENHFFEIMYRIGYETTQDVRLQTERTNKIAHNSTLFDSQEANFVNVESFAKNSLSKLNRMSNNERTISALYTSYDDVPKLGDYIDDYILTNREISIYDNYIAFNGILTKDYSNLYQFNAINSKKRFYQISNSKDALIRHEMYKFYLAYGYKQNTLTGYDSIVEDVLKQTALGPRFVLLKERYIKDDGVTYKLDRYIAREITKYSAGNSVLMTFGFDDNVVGGTRVGSSATGGYYQQPVNYVDNYGENTAMEMRFRGDGHDFYFNNGTDYRNFWLDYNRYYPRIDDENVNKFFGWEMFDLKVYKHKDQREIQKWTLQFDIISDDEDILIADKMYQDNVFMKNSYSGTFDKYRVYKFTDTIKKSEISSIDLTKGELQTYVDDEGQTKNITPEITDNYFTINASGNLVVGYLGYKDVTNAYIVLNNYVAGTRVYCNIRKTR